MAESFGEILKKMLEQYEQKPKTTPTGLVNKSLPQDVTNDAKQSAITLAKKVGKLFEEFDKNMQSLQDEKRKLHSRDEWINQQLKEIIPNWSKEERKQLVNGFRQSLTKSMSSLSGGTDLDSARQNQTYDSPVLNQYIESEMNEENDRRIKSVVATALAAATAIKTDLSGKTDEELTKIAFRIAAEVDEGMSRVKMMYRVASGKMKSEEYADILGDRGAARFISVIRHFTWIGTYFGLRAAISLVFPEAAMLQIFYNTILPILSIRVGDLISLYFCKAIGKARQTYDNANTIDKKISDTIFFEELTKR